MLNAVEPSVRIHRVLLVAAFSPFFAVVTVGLAATTLAGAKSCRSVAVPLQKLVVIVVVSPAPPLG